jgi:YfiH family protein
VPQNWIEAQWSAPHTVVAGTTLRHGGLSGGAYASFNLAAHVNDDPRNVAENRRIFRQQCNLPRNPSWIRQVHGIAVVTDSEPGSNPRADAIVSRREGAVCVVLTADCLPVVFASADGVEIAAAHAGWRGLLNGVLEATVKAMKTPPADIVAWLGPAISQGAFEVGHEVRDAFVACDADSARHFLPNSRERWQADLRGLARRRLASVGIDAVGDSERCTFKEKDAYFSYRREGECGRMATFVFRNIA